MKFDMKVQTAISNIDKMTFYHHSNDNIIASPTRISRSGSKKSIGIPNHFNETSKNTTASPTAVSLTPPPSPSPKSKLRYSHKNCIKKDDRSIINTLADEAIEMYEKSVEQCNATELRYKQLDLTMKTTLSMQTKTYEHCIDELNIKIKKLEEEKIQQQIELNHEDESCQDDIIHQQYISEDNNDFINNILINYTCSDNKLQDDEDSSTITPEEYTKKIEMLLMQIAECEQSTHKTVLHYVSELEKERLETKKLHSIILKQEELISVLETKLKKQELNQDDNINRKQDKEAPLSASTTTITPSSSSDELLKVQVELQGIELENKKRLLAVLVDEREELLKKVELLSKEKKTPPTLSYSNKNNNSAKIKNRSSIDLLAKIAKSGFIQQDRKPIKSPPKPFYSHVIDHATPPPSPPPSAPLPPTPVVQQSSPLPTTSTKSTSFFRKSIQKPIKHTTKSWSYLNFYAVRDKANCYNIPKQQKPMYKPVDNKTLDKDWGERILNSFCKRASKPESHIYNSNTSSFSKKLNSSSFFKSWKRSVQ